MASREFSTGATRNDDKEKLDYEAFNSVLVDKRYAEFMHENRFQSDGSLRDGDNWQLGIGLDSYMKSGFRHFMDWRFHHRRYSELAGEDLETALCAVIFNAKGYLHEVLKKNGKT